MNVCFFGIGGVGGYYGALLTRYFNETGKGKTFFIARNKHKDAILEKGLLLKKEGGKEFYYIPAIFFSTSASTETSRIVRIRPFF